MPVDDDQWSSDDTQSQQILFLGNKVIVTAYALGLFGALRVLTIYAVTIELTHIDSNL